MLIKNISMQILYKWNAVFVELLYHELTDVQH